MCHQPFSYIVSLALNYARESDLPSLVLAQNPAILRWLRANAHAHYINIREVNRTHVLKKYTKACRNTYI